MTFDAVMEDLVRIGPYVLIVLVLIALLTVFVHKK